MVAEIHFLAAPLAHARARDEEQNHSGEEQA